MILRWATLLLFVSVGCAKAPEPTPTAGSAAAAAVDLPSVVQSGEYSSDDGVARFTMDAEHRRFRLRYPVKSSVRFRTGRASYSALAASDGDACWLEISGRFTNPAERNGAPPSRTLRAEYVRLGDLKVASHRKRSVTVSELRGDPVSAECDLIARLTERDLSDPLGIGYLPVLSRADGVLEMASLECFTASICDAPYDRGQTYRTQRRDTMPLSASGSALNIPRE